MLRSMTAFDELLELAGEQHGVLARRQAVRLLGRYPADSLLRSSRFERCYRATYRLRGSPAGALQRAIALTLSHGSHAVLTGPAALMLTGGPTLEGDERCLVAVRRQPRGAAQDTETILDRGTALQTTKVGEVLVAQPMDALLDALCLRPTPDSRSLRLLHDRLRWSGVLRPGDLRERAAQRRILDRQDLAGLLQLDSTRATGDGERRLGELLGCFDPPPEPQAWVTPHRRVDWFFRSVRLGVEYQGALDHDHAEGRARDRARTEELDQAGVRLLFVTAADLANERALLTHVGSALVARAQLLEVDAPRFRSR